MKLKTLLAMPNVNPRNRNRFGMIRAVHFTVEELKANRYTHLAVEMDGTIFAWSGKDRPLSMLRGDKSLDGWFSNLNINNGIRDCNLGEMVGSLGYAPVNWHRMVWAL
ncbi:hypothetical protein KL3_00065 [Klebsiella phage KL3]|nr:hypothetical protein KL3_00065 [Klebsiella phage KL3]